MGALPVLQILACQRLSSNRRAPPAPDREAPPEADLCWRELAIVAKAVVDGRDVTEIGWMRDIALQTIAVLRDAWRM